MREVRVMSATVDGLPPAVEESSGPSLRVLVQRGALWSMAAYGGSHVLRLVGNLILTRLLFPEAFGLMALVSGLLVGLQLFSDIGIGPSIVQNPRGDEPAFLNTAWTLQALRGGVLWIVACALAWPFAAVYEDPLLAWILPVAGLTTLIAGFNSTRLFSMHRHVDLARISAIEVASYTVGLVVMIGWAALEHSIWALVAGGLTSSLVKLVLSHTALPGISNRFHLERTAARGILRFGRWIFFSTVLTFFTGQSDRLIFGKLVPMAMLGVYNVGLTIATMPESALDRIGHSVLFPAYSRVHNSGRDLAPVFARVRRPLLLLVGWMSAGLCGGGDVAVRLLYDERYVEAGWIVQLLALGCWFSMLETTNGAALLARGQANWIAASSAGKLVGMAVLIPVGYHFAGFPGAVLGLAASEILKYAVSAFAAARAGLKGWPQDLLLTSWVLATAGMGFLLASHAMREGWSSLTAACAVFAAVSAAWAPFGASLLSARRKG